MKQYNMQYWGVLLIGLALAVVVIGKLFNQDPAIQNLSLAFSTPDWQEPLGRDHFGRSNLARLSDAIFTSLLLAGISVLTSASLGTFAGVVSGWKRGWWDRAFSFLMNIILAMPGLILVLLFAALIPGSFTILYIAIALILWVEFFRVTRNRTMSVIRSPEVEASILYGFGNWYVFKRHIWPHCKKDVFTLSCFGAGNTILALASLGFLHVGLKPPEAELGLMMVELFRYYHVAPWVLIQPLISVFVLVLGFHLLANGEQS